MLWRQLHSDFLPVEGASEKRCILTRDLQGQAVVDVLYVADVLAAKPTGLALVCKHSLPAFWRKVD